MENKELKNIKVTDLTYRGKLKNDVTLDFGNRTVIFEKDVEIILMVVVVAAK